MVLGRAVAATAVTAAVVVAAWGTSALAAAPPQPKTAEELAAMIGAKGLNCSDFQSSANNPSNVDEGSCTVGHEADVTLDVLASKAALKKLLPAARTGFCTELKQAKSTIKIVLVVGPNWVASFESTTNARPLANALKAKVQPLKC